MIYDLKQYGCDNCGKLSEVLDYDQPLPKGWVWEMDSHHTCYCKECAKILKRE